MTETARLDRIDRHILALLQQDGQGAGGEDFATARYEGFGPAGAMFIVDCLTDNAQRTISEVRNCFTKTGSKLGATGSVALWFDQLAVLSFKGTNDDEVMEAMLNADVNIDDVESKDGTITIFAPPSEFSKPRRRCCKPFRTRS